MNWRSRGEVARGGRLCGPVPEVETVSTGPLTQTSQHLRPRPIRSVLRQNGTPGRPSATGIIIDESDRRLKTNITPLPTSLEAMMNLKPVSFRMKANPADTELGFIAQDVEPLFPHLVKTSSDPSATKSMNYIGLIAPTGKALQELNQKLDEEKQVR